MVEIGPEVQSLDQRRFQQLFRESRVLGDGGHHQRGPDLLQHFRLRHFHHTGVRTEKFAVRQRMRERIAQHDRRPQINAALEFHFARAVAIFGGDIRRAGRFQILLQSRRR